MIKLRSDRLGNISSIYPDWFICLLCSDSSLYCTWYTACFYLRLFFSLSCLFHIIAKPRLLFFYSFAFLLYLLSHSSYPTRFIFSSSQSLFHIFYVFTTISVKNVFYTNIICSVTQFFVVVFDRGETESNVNSLKLPVKGVMWLAGNAAVPAAECTTRNLEEKLRRQKLEQKESDCLISDILALREHINEQLHEAFKPSLAMRCYALKDD